MKQEKTLLLDQIQQHLETSTFVVINNKGLDANSEAEMRIEIAKFGARFMTLKKRMLMKAAANKGLDFNRQQLDGHISVLSIGENVVEAIKTLYKYKEEKENKLDVLLGRYEGAFCTPHDIEQISKLPSKDQMRAEFLGLLEAVPATTLGTLEAILTSVLYCLENKTKQNEAS